VLTNVLIGSTFGKSSDGLAAFRFTPRAAEVALQALELVGLTDQAAIAGSLPTLERKRLMLATALATGPSLLLLDEPVGGLNAAERETMIQLINRINATGVTVLMIEHVMKAVQALASRMLVLHHGQKIAEGIPAEVLRDVRVIDVYLGAVAAGRPRA
jgi:branched-chain amino acid transport system ATP-binding protein